MRTGGQAGKGGDSPQKACNCGLKYENSLECRYFESVWIRCWSSFV
jgi:hypothetical protein